MGFVLFGTAMGHFAQSPLLMWEGYMAMSHRIVSINSTRNKLAGNLREPTIVCPKCNKEIKLTESLAAPLIESTRRKYEAEFAAKEADLAARLKSELAAIAKQETKKARQEVATEIQKA